jgi:lipid-binding SYLF domain-containing protein
VVFTKGGFIVGVGGGEGVLTFRGHHYRFNVSGMSVGFTIGASTTQFTGRALNLRSPGDIQGTYAVIGAGGALAAGAGGVQLQNEKGVILQLAGGRVGVELSAAVGGVTIALK